MPNEIGSQSQNSLRNDEPYHSHHHHHPSLYDSQLLLHHHANAHSHQSLHFNHEVPIGVNHGIGNNTGHHPYIQSPSPHPFHQGGNHSNIHQSHFEPEDYSPGSAGSGGGAVIESSSLTNGSRIGDPFSASMGSGTNPHGSHFYGPTAGM